MSDSDEITTQRGTSPISLTLAIELAAIVLAFTVSTLVAESFWTDELYTRAFADVRLSLAQLWSELLVNSPHPPTYYLAMREWSMHFGDSPFAMRAFSVLAFTLLLLLPFTALGRTVLAERRNAFLVLLATSFLLVRFAQEARSYEWLAFFAALTMLLSIAILQRLLENRTLGKKLIIAAFIAYPLTALLHFYGFLYVGLFLSYLFFTALFVRRWSAATIITTIGVLVIVLEGVWLFESSTFLTSISGGNNWIRFDIIPQEIVSFFVKAFSANVLLVGILLYALFRYRGNISRSAPDVMLLVIIALGIIVPILVSLHSPVLIDRFLIVFAPALFFVCAGLLTRFFGEYRSRLWETGGRLVFALSVVGILFLSRVTVKPDWELTARIVDSFKSCGEDSIIAYPISHVRNSPLHGYALRHQQIKLETLTQEHAEAAMGNQCIIFGWFVRASEERVDQLLQSVGMNLEDFDRFWAHETVLLFKRQHAVSETKRNIETVKDERSYP
jgi:uncharacterized membrane protein